MGLRAFAFYYVCGRRFWSSSCERSVIGTHSSPSQLPSQRHAARRVLQVLKGIYSPAIFCVLHVRFLCE